MYCLVNIFTNAGHHLAMACKTSAEYAQVARDIESNLHGEDFFITTVPGMEGFIKGSNIYAYYTQFWTDAGLEHDADFAAEREAFAERSKRRTAAIRSGK